MSDFDFNRYRTDEKFVCPITTRDLQKARRSASRSIIAKMKEVRKINFKSRQNMQIAASINGNEKVGYNQWWMFDEHWMCVCVNGSDFHHARTNQDQPTSHLSYHPTLPGTSVVEIYNLSQYLQPNRYNPMVRLIAVPSKQYHPFQRSARNLLNLHRPSQQRRFSVANARLLSFKPQSPKVFTQLAL